VPVLRDFLAEHVAITGRNGSELIFGKTADTPVHAVTLQRHADEAWANAKALQTFMGHATISITLDRYGHLMPGTEQEAAGMLHEYLSAQRERAEQAARAATTLSV
jgi:hypothetical protein